MVRHEVQQEGEHKTKSTKYKKQGEGGPKSKRQSTKYKTQKDGGPKRKSGVKATLVRHLKLISISTFWGNHFFLFSEPLRRKQ